MRGITTPGAIVRVYRGTYVPGSTPPVADRVLEVTTTRSLYPAQTERFVVELSEADQRAIVLDGTVGAYATVEVAAGVQECRADNNVGVLDRLCALL